MWWLQRRIAIARLRSKLASLELLVLDVDGVLTDGGIVLGDRGEEFKRFDVRDGLGIALLRAAGMDVAMVTGRTSEIVRRRAAELGIDCVIQGATDKREALRSLLNTRNISPERVAYMGDDLPDLPAMLDVGVTIAPRNAALEVRRSVHFVTRRGGGNGAVREAIEWLLRSRGQWHQVWHQYLMQR